MQLFVSFQNLIDAKGEIVTVLQDFVVEGLGGCSVGFVVPVWSIRWFLHRELQLAVGDVYACGLSFHGEFETRKKKK